MRIGYLFRGYLGDVKMDAEGNELSTPDGNATYSWSIEHECDLRKHKLIPLGENLDAPAASRLGHDLFSSFSQVRRTRGYERMLLRGWTQVSNKLFPELDLVLIEWRWPIPGRNTPQDYQSPLYQNDLERQQEVLEHYLEAGTPIVVWDLDHKLSLEDQGELVSKGVRVIETSTTAADRGRVRVEPPFVVKDLLQHDIDEKAPGWYLGYIGSRYERDETIDRWIKPIAKPNTHRVKFWGKWEPDAEVRERWPGIAFAGRIGVRGFRAAYTRVAAVPLLAKQSYYDTGFITPRVWEALLFGAMPVGLKGHRDIDQYTEFVAQDPTDLLDKARRFMTLSSVRRRVFREEAAHRLSHMDVRNFVDVLEGLCS